MVLVRPFLEAGLLDVCCEALKVAKGGEGKLPNYSLWVSALNCFINCAHFKCAEGLALRKDLLQRCGLVREVSIVSASSARIPAWEWTIMTDQMPGS